MTRYDETHIGVRVYVGVSRAGKTYALKRDVWRHAAHMPIIVVDRMHEWNEAPAAIKTAGAYSFEQVKRHVASGARLVIWRTRELDKSVEEACTFARDYPGVAGVAIPEAHRAAPNGPRLTPALEDCVTAWAHHGVALWCDTQRFALLNQTLVEQATKDLRLFALLGDRNIERVRNIGGRELVAAVEECVKRFGAGERGWYVSLSASRVPPFRLARER